ncbi:MAG TPA: hypothetical protein VM307_07245 [Egibacteraceae bacterium]|nr:hypothetical protein [Egibacteraceae bacterium]
MLRFARYLLVPFLVGAVSLGAAWAGVVVAPAPEVTPEALAAQVAPADDAAAAAPGKTKGDLRRNAATQPATGGQAAEQTGFTGSVPAGRVLAGAAKVSIVPQPDESKGERWAKEGCAIIGSDAPSGATHVPDFRSPWPENPECIYMGGYGIGPMNPITSVDEEYGLWVRSVAIGDGQDTVVLTVLDGVSYLGDYNRFCDDCGAFELARDLGQELGIDPAGFFFASTHSHTAPDFIGGWGGVPEWYMTQVTEALRTSVRRAVAKMQPATLEAGESLAREHNGERRDTYRSAESNTLSWFRAVNPGGKTIATVGAYAAHPVTVSPKGVGDADYPAVFNAEVERRFGGVGLYFMKGLGNMSPRGDKVKMGTSLAALLPAIGGGTPVQGTDVRAARAMWDQPVTNPGLTALGTPGFFDRTFSQKPAAVRIGKSDRRPCTSTSPVSVNTGITAAKVGNLWLTGAPGETFSNLANTIEERNPNGVTLPLAQVNDGLGYIIQNFESYADGRMGPGFVGENVFEYEDAYALDQCFGDMTLETTLQVLANL